MVGGHRMKKLYDLVRLRSVGHGLHVRSAISRSVGGQGGHLLRWAGASVAHAIVSHARADSFAFGEGR